MAGSPLSYVTKYRESDGQPDVMGLAAPPWSPPPRVDGRKMTARGLLTAEVRDRQGDVLRVSGLDLSEHMLNAVALVDHGRWHALPIGVCDDGQGGYTVEADPHAGEVWQTTRFSQSSQVAEQVFALIAEGMLKGNSAGFRPVEWTPLPPDPEEGFRASRDAPAGKDIIRSRLVEVTWAATPVNQEAARAIVGKSLWCGKPLAPALLDQFRPWLPERRTLPVRGGWDRGESEGLATKAWAYAAPSAPASPGSLEGLEAIPADPARMTDGIAASLAEEDALEADEPSGIKAWSYADADEREAIGLARKAWEWTEKARVARAEGEVWTVGGNRYTKVGGKIRRAPAGGRNSPRQTEAEYAQWQKKQRERFQGPARPKGDPQKAREAVLAHIAKGDAATADDIHALANTLRGLTVAEITAIKKEQGVKASGVKWDLAAKVADRLIAAVRAKAGTEAAKDEPKPQEPAKPAAPAKPVHDSPDVQAAFGDAYRKLAARASRVGGVVKIPELIDAMKEAVPGIEDAQIHAALKQWQKEDKLTLQKLNLAREEPRAGEAFLSDGGHPLFYVDARDDEASAFPAKLQAKPQRAGAGAGPPEPGFTGIDGNGHKWIDGVQVARGEPAGRAKGKLDGTRTDGRGRSAATGGANEGAGAAVAGAAGQAGSAEADRGGDSRGESLGRAAAERVPADGKEVGRRLDRFAKFFGARGQHQVAEWMGTLRGHIEAMGADAALQALGGTGKGAGDGSEVQYWGVGTEEANWKNTGRFIEAYLARNGITAVTGDQSSPDSLLISALGAPDRYVAGQDFKPAGMHFKDKLTEAKTLPGLEKSADISDVMGQPVTHLTEEVTSKLDAEYGPGQWIVKCYDDNAAAGYGIFFPQRAAAIRQDARNTIWDAGSRLAQYGFSLKRDGANKIVGLKHQGGDEYDFGTEKYANTIGGDARHWADRAANAAHHEQGAMLPEGSFMVQPAFKAVGISDAERAAGKTWHEKNEGRVHLVTRQDGSVEVVPHSTWLKGGSLPVVFEDDDTRAMAAAAKKAIEAIPYEARKGQVYAPDIMKTADGYSVVELNAQGDSNGSGYLHDNGFTIDAYTSYLAGREPLHVQFIRRLLTARRASGGEKAWAYADAGARHTAWLARKAWSYAD